MPRAETQALVSELIFRDKGFTQGTNKAIAQTNRLGSTLSNVGNKASEGLASARRNVGLIGVAAVGGIALAVRSGLADLATLENAVTSVDGSIKQLGLTGQLTGKQVADWANDIERDIDAAFDDKAITQAATTLLRFGRVTPKALKQALTVTADLAAKTGDVESASTLLAKALADPTKAAGKLTRAGVILTKQQQDQIKAMVEAGDVASAQALVLDAVAKSTGGAAKAMAGPYQDAINKTNDAIEDGRKALAVGFLPVITKVADKLSKIVADPKALASIEAFGRTLAGGLDDLISLAERLPWGTIGQSLQIAGTGAKAVLNAFTSLPPWVQTAVLTGWGLNKLTGGALSGIVGELGKGLIKGVLGMTAATVGIKATAVTVSGPVVGGGGGPGVPTKGPGPIGTIAQGVAGLGLAGIAQVAIVGLAPVAVAGLAQALIDATGATARAQQGKAETAAARGVPEPIRGRDPGHLPGSGVKVTDPKQQAAIEAAARDSAVRDNATNERLDAIRAEQVKTAAAMAPTRTEMIRVREAVNQSKVAISQKITDSRSELFRTRTDARAHANLVAARITSTRSEQAATRQAVVAAQERARQAIVAAQAVTSRRIQEKNFEPRINITNQTRVAVSVRDTIRGNLTFKSVFHHAV